MPPCRSSSSFNRISSGGIILPPTLAQKQWSDPYLLNIINYIETGELPNDDRLARTIAAKRPCYVVIDEVLYQIDKDGSHMLLLLVSLTWTDLQGEPCIPSSARPLHMPTRSRLSLCNGSVLWLGLQGMPRAHGV